MFQLVSWVTVETDANEVTTHLGDTTFGVDPPSCTPIIVLPPAEVTLGG